MLGHVHTVPEKSENAASTVEPVVHTNPSPQQSF